MLDALPFADQPRAGDRAVLDPAALDSLPPARRPALPAARWSPASARHRPIPECDRPAGFRGSAGCRAAARCRTDRAISASGPRPAWFSGRPIAPKLPQGLAILLREGLGCPLWCPKSRVNFLRVGRFFAGLLAPLAREGERQQLDHFKQVRRFVKLVGIFSPSHNCAAKV